MNPESRLECAFCIARASGQFRAIVRARSVFARPVRSIMFKPRTMIRAEIFRRCVMRNEM